MASSEGLASVDHPGSYRQSFNNNNIDSWLISESFSHETDILSKALQTSISTDSLLSPSYFFDSTTDLPPPLPQTLSNVSFVSDPDISAVADGAKRKRAHGVSGDKPAKRRSRVSLKKSQTTFITADADNFREMVQQVTGGKSIGSFNRSPIVKPEPYRLATRLPPSWGNLDQSPTLVDTSSFLSNHQQEHIVTDLGSVSAPMGSFHQSSSAKTVKGGGGSAVESDSYPNYPTLESWTPM